MTVLFRLAEWHALAKLRMHTDSTLSRMEAVTSMLGRELRRFCSVTCTSFHTVELPKEAAARSRKQSRKQAPTQPQNAPMSLDTSTLLAETLVTPELEVGRDKTEVSKAKAKPKRKVLNLSTYKMHALGDYVRTIRMFGTTDSYSTQTVGTHICFSIQVAYVIQGELEHRRVKRLYSRTNKNRAIRQITVHERWETRILRAQRTADSHKSKTHPHHVPFSHSDPLPYTDILMHHHISEFTKHSQDAFSFERQFPNGPATKVSTFCLILNPGHRCLWN